MSELDLNLLYVLVALDDRRSVSGAALQLQRSQPAVSSALSRLRAFFDDPLFVRTGNVMQPTPRGSAIVESARSVTATFSNSGTGTTCTNPITFSGGTGNFNTAGAVCYRTSASINGWGCYNFEGRTVTVGGEARNCSQMPLTRSSDGYYYFSVSGGTYPWAGLYTW